MFFDLVTYLREQNIVHVLAHPLFAVNERLTVENFEKALLMFNVLELNGTRDELQNTALKTIAENLTPQKILQLADKHYIEPYGDRPWSETFDLEGSDDHSGLNIARVYTEIMGAENLQEMLTAVSEGRTLIQGNPATPHTMAHNLYGIAYQFYKSQFNIDDFKRSADCFQFIDNALDPGEKEDPTLLNKLQSFIYRRKSRKYFETSDSVQAALLREANNIVANDSRAQKVLQRLKDKARRVGRRMVPFCR